MLLLHVLLLLVLCVLVSDTNTFIAAAFQQDRIDLLQAARDPTANHKFATLWRPVSSVVQKEATTSRTCMFFTSSSSSSSSPYGSCSCRSTSSSTGGRCTRQERIQKQGAKRGDGDNGDTHHGRGSDISHEIKHHQRRAFSVWEDWPLETEAKPRRLLSDENVAASGRTTPLLQESWTDWGIQQEDNSSSGAENADKNTVVQFPCTVESVADEAFQAIAGTLYNRQRPDPNLLQNALVGHGGNPFGRRPCRYEWDQGRIGIEIDGAKHLSWRDDKRQATDGSTSKTPDEQELLQPERYRSNARSIRRVALALAGKLSQKPWDGFEEEEGAQKHQQQRRPVAVYFNTLKQALAASHELRLLKRAELGKQNENGKTQKQSRRGRRRRDLTNSTMTVPFQTSYDNVTIHCLGNGDEIPDSMLHSSSLAATEKPAKRSNGSRILYRQQSGQVDPTAGLLLIVQPTDYNDEYRPPGPAIGSVEGLQRLVARASVLALPTVVVSPRFSLRATDYDNDDEQIPSEEFSSSLSSSSAAASASIAVSTFGGYEPPRGPNPWILRDFLPPVFSWIGRGLTLDNGYSSRSRILAPTHKHKHEQQHNVDEENKLKEAAKRHGQYTGVSLVQSVMYKGHSWRLFASKQTELQPSLSSSSSSSSQRRRPVVDYTYLASTRSGSGRPTRALMQRVLEEFAPPLSSSEE